MADPAPAAPRWPFSLALPGFAPDAVPFALRTTLSLLLAYAVAFTAQIQAASTAGICVAIVAQPSAGMAFSKARYRMMGTLLGGVVAVLMLGAFPQDRTMLLIAYALWLGICTFVGTLLRDFRSYGAVLSGYTAGVIAIAYIDAPQAGFAAALDRVAAISTGIVCVLAVNLVFASTGAFRALLDGLRQQRHRVAALAADVLDGAAPPDDLAVLGIASTISALRSQATFAGTELPDGAIRSNGARHVIEALLTLLTTARLTARAIGPDTPPAWRSWLHGIAGSVRDGRPPPVPPVANDPAQVLLQQGAADVLTCLARADAGLRTLEHGEGDLPRIRVQVSYDWIGALIGAIRSCIAIAIVCVFTIVAGWNGATLLVIQGTAIIALLGAAPNPTQASLPFAWTLPPMAVLVGAVKFLVLPQVAGFVPFALSVAPLVFATALLVRHATLSAYGAPSLLFMTLLLSPTNPQGFDFGGYCNTVLELLLSVALVLLTFRLILPVSPARRLGRVAAEIAQAWRGGGRQGPAPPSLLYDRLSRVMQWLGPATPARRSLVAHLYAAGELDLCQRRAHEALAQLQSEAGLVQNGQRSLVANQPAAMMQSAQALLDSQVGPDQPAIRQATAVAVATLAAAALTLRRFPGLARFGHRLAS